MLEFVVSFYWIAQVMQAVCNKTSAHTQFLRDFSHTQSLFPECVKLVFWNGYFVLKHMLFSREKLKIFKSIVTLIAVFVVNLLPRQKLTPQVLLHNPAMHSHCAAIYGDIAVRQFVILIRDTGSFIVGIATAEIAKGVGVLFKMTRFSKQRLPTSFALHFNFCAHKLALYLRSYFATFGAFCQVGNYQGQRA